MLEFDISLVYAFFSVQSGVEFYNWDIGFEMALLVPIDNLLDAPKFVPEIFTPTLESVLAASVFVGRFLTF